MKSMELFAHLGTIIQFHLAPEIRETYSGHQQREQMMATSHYKMHSHSHVYPHSLQAFAT